MCLYWRMTEDEAEYWANRELRELAMDRGMAYDDRDASNQEVEKSGHWACVYCGKQLPEQHSACCGEVGHTEWAEDEEVSA